MYSFQLRRSSPCTSDPQTTDGGQLIQNYVRSRRTGHTSITLGTPDPKDRTLTGRFDGRVGLRSLVPLTKQLKQQRENVDEVQLEGECAQNRRALRRLAIHSAMQILALEPLRVPGGKSGEDQNAHHRDHELQRRARHEEIYQAGENYAEQTHQQERAHATQITLRRIPPEA